MRRRDFLWRFRRIAHDVNAFIGGEVPVREVEADAKRGVAVRCEDQIRGEQRLRRRAAPTHFESVICSTAPSKITRPIRLSRTLIQGGPY